jgi:lysophospholipase L1-like esterase
MKKIIRYGVFALLLQTTAVFAQSKTQFVYTNAEELTVVGKAVNTKYMYQRVDTAMYPALPAHVKQLLTHGTGIAISFRTNSSAISAKWCVTNSKPYPNLTAIANKGLDLYIKNGDKWQAAGVGRPKALCSDDVLIDNMDNSEKDCLLYLPLYDAVKKLEIGIDAKAQISAAPDPFRKRILIYGSSIVQGAGASRSGVAYPAQLSRQTGLNFINLGLSGSAKMEPAAADMVASIDADVYLLDCVPNTTPAQIKERTAYLINTIRQHHPTAPIIVMQSLIREQGYWNQKLGSNVKNQNINIQNEVLALLNSGFKDLYFITSEQLLGNDHEGSIDGTHPNDLGYYRMSQALLPQLLTILKKYDITANKQDSSLAK